MWIMNDVKDFLKELYSQVKTAGIDVAELKIDHIAYSTASSEEYEKLKPFYLAKGQLVQEALISDRRVAIIKLNQPISFENQLIDVMELIEPIKNQKAITGWEHAEFLVDNYDTLLNKYPKLNWNTSHKNRENFSRIKLTLPSGLEVKFLDTPVLESAKLEN
jgi:predicted metalloenzyme YecM